MASDINLVFYSSTMTMMHGPINIRVVLDFKLPPCSECFVCFLPGKSPASEFYMPDPKQILETILHKLKERRQPLNTQQFDLNPTRALLLHTLHSLFLYSEPPLTCHPSSY